MANPSEREGRGRAGDAPPGEGLGSRERAGRAPRDVVPSGLAGPRYNDTTPFEGTRSLDEPRRRYVRILFVSANAAPDRSLQLDEEYRAIERELRAAEQGDAFRLIPCLAARIEELRGHLIRYKPDVVHFAGRGDGGLVFLDDARQPVSVRLDTLASIVRTGCDEVRLVIFNARFCAEQATAICQRVGLAVGLLGEGDDGAGAEFVGAFYRAICGGRSVRAAFDLGVESAGAKASGEAACLLERYDVRAEDTFFVEEPSASRRPSGRHEVGAVGRVRRLEAALQARTVALALALGASGVFALAPVSRLFSNPLPPVSLLPSVATTTAPAMPLPPSGFEAGLGRSIAIKGARVDLGAADEASRPPECASAGSDCGGAACPGRGRSVEVAGFSLDATEVTNEDFARWLEARAGTWHLATGDVVLTNADPNAPLALAGGECNGGLFVEGGRVRVRPGHERRPIACVTWQGANDYCQALGKRLPSSAEWWVAAKGPESRPFPWGAGRPTSTGVAFGGETAGFVGPREVASSAIDRTPEGVFDLGGNVAEWVSDGGEAGRKASCGGSWQSTSVCNLLGSGIALRPAKTYGNDVGFRCARDAF